ncbi:MAG TPA: hypothetical protein VG370_20815 [Chloroflexota bacterium]|jgi:hypothetical protein|nr:hypothetical protein [Chloroflexota bacterium]
MAARAVGTRRPEREVRDALVHLPDLGYPPTQPLGAALGGSASLSSSTARKGSPAFRGKRRPRFRGA